MEVYPMSSAQKRVYTLSQFDKESTNYNMPAAYIVEGTLDIEKLENVFKALVERHEALRTSFLLQDGVPVQKVEENVEFEVIKIETKGTIDLKSPESDKLLRTIGNEFVKAFDLSKAPLIRVGVMEISENKYLLMYDKHHIISDGVSRGIILREFIRLYNDEELLELKLRYKDFAVWQNELFEKGIMDKQKEYWLDKFKDEISVLNLPTDYNRPAIKTFEGDTIAFIADKQLKERLNKLALKTGTTMYMTLMAAYNVLLYKYTSQEDIIVGLPTAGRPHNDLQDIVGMFVNTLAMRNNPRGNATFKEFLEEVKINSLNAFANQDYQFEELIENLDVRRDLSRNPLFDVMFVMQNTGTEEVEAEEIEAGGLKVKALGVESNISKFDMTMIAEESADEIIFNLEYSTKLFKKETIENLAEHYLNLLEKIVDNPEETLDRIDIILEKEKQKLLVDFNETKEAYKSTSTIQEIFEEEVMKNPDKIALIFEDTEVTYEELNKKANILARNLREVGVQGETIVAIMIERSIEMIVGILGVLKAGGAYLPIDPTYPEGRKEYMLKDSGAKVLLCDKSLLKGITVAKDKSVDERYREDSGLEMEDLKLEFTEKNPNNGDTNDEYKISGLRFEGQVLDIVDAITENFDKVDSTNKFEDTNLEPITTAENLAYVIYTSGSTGKPKGVMLEHTGVANLKAFFQKEFKVTEKDTVIQFASSSFDASVWEIFMALHNGATLVMVSKDTINDSRKFEDYLNSTGVTIATLPPTYLENLDKEKLKTLRMVITAGSATNPELLENWKKDFEYVNAYGPTETTVCATAWKAEAELDNGIIPIGKPITNTRIYILDKAGALAPIGVVGEICVAGDGLARGYLNRPELTAEKFIETIAVPNERLYRTGDLGRWLPDGNIQFLGRIDYQVKIRGYRIELGEIENKLIAHEGIKKVTVVDKELKNGEKVICAYYVSEETFNTSELREYLLEDLPEYMIPSFFIKLDTIPMTSNDKVDRKALPAPYEVVKELIHEEPKTSEEKIMVELWKQVLGIEEMGVTDNFFEIGGYSLKATELMFKINREFNVSISFAEIFKNPTARELTKVVNILVANAENHRGSETRVSDESNKGCMLLKDGNIQDNGLFFIHDGSGEIGGYIDLTTRLTTDSKVWGIRADKLSGYAPEDRTIESIASKYISFMKKVQPSGTYNIVGWSIGGSIAFEIVRQLEEANETIGYFAMIDSMSPEPKYARRLKGITAKEEKEFIKSLIANKEIIKEINKSSDVENIWLMAMKYLKEEIKSENQLKELKLLIPKHIAALVENFENCDLDELIRSVNIVRTMINAAMTYVPTAKVKSDINYFSAKSDDGSNSEGWDIYFEKPFNSYHEIDANHFTIVKGENASKIAEEIDLSIKQS
ncbi:amino acid adenylation domain-containing protein [Clostridium cellulovorans]